MLLEREQELGELDSALEEMAAGNGCAIGIEARAGLGKTSLVQEARARAVDAGIDVLAGRATELEQDFPFALVRQLLGAAVSALSEQERERVFDGAAAARGALGLEAGAARSQDAFAVLHALYWVTAALSERNPLLLAVDDAHSADAASLDYLGFLLPRLEELPVLLLVTGRPDEPDPSGGFRRIMADAFVRPMTLAPLSPEATAALLGEELASEPTPPFAAACFEVTGGNPFLLRELSRTVFQRRVEPSRENAEVVRELVPERVAQTVLVRLDRLAPEARAVARSLAVLGDGSEFHLVAELAGLRADEAALAADSLRAGAILDPGPSPSFVHPLVRSAVYASIPAGERGQMHAEAAACLLRAESSPEQVATQLLATAPRNDRATVETLVEAGERALAAGAPRSAIAYLRRALSEPAPTELRASVLEPLITAVVRAADNETFEAIQEQLWAEMERDPELLSRWAISLTVALAIGGRFEDAAALIGDAIEVAEGQGDFSQAFVLGAQLNTLAAIVPSVSELDLGRFAREVDPDSAAGRLAASLEARSALTRGTAREAADAGARAFGREAVIFDENPEFVAAVATILTLIAADEIAVARQAAERAIAIARDHGAVSTLVRAWTLSAVVAWGEGELLRAEPEMRQAVELARTAGSAPLALSITPVLIEILVERDELEAAERELETIGMADGPIPASPMFTILLYARGHLRLEGGDVDRALEDFAGLSYAEEGWDFGHLNVSHVGPLTGRALRARKERDRIRQLAGSMEPLAKRWDCPSTTAHFLRTRAAGADGQEAIDDLEAAAAVLEGSPRRLEHVHALIDLGEALRRGGRRADARPPLRSALGLARRCGAARVAKRAHDELLATGEKVRSYAPIGVESLTPSERRVAELAATGMTNRQIAQSLFVTLKTVEAHLSATYDKLDIESRRELPGALGDGADPAG